jgi:hypothetical protein
MKFIYPKNYKYKAKILGFIDYVTAIFDLIIGIILWSIIHVILKKITTQIYVFIILFIPILLFSVLETGGENIIIYTVYIIKFFKNRKVYFYRKYGSSEKIKDIEDQR